MQRFKTVTLRLLPLMLVALCGYARAELAAETLTVEKLGKAADTWFLAKVSSGAGFVFDAASGEMQGTLSLSPFTPAAEVDRPRGEIYAAEVYYSRRYRGQRNDVLTVYDHENLRAIHEVDLPDKVASLNFAEYISLLGDRRFLTVFNMTPGQSVSVVDVQRRRFVGEISTPGCALTMSTGARGFLMMCGDGTLQLIRLDKDGAETKRLRSKSFFSIDVDPVFDQPVRVADGWRLVSFEGRVFDVGVAGDDIVVSEPWSLLTETDREEKWRVGGGQIFDVHHDLNLLYALMHQGDADTHEDPGTEVWVYSVASKQRIARLPLQKPTRGVLVTQNDAPLLIASSAEEPDIEIYNATTLVNKQTIELGQTAGLLMAY